MSEREQRYQIGREEIGILMSYATRPDRLTSDVIAKLRAGVTRPELVELSAWLGLPQSTPARLIDANTSQGRSRSGRRGAPDTRYRRALIGLLGAYLAVETVFMYESARSRPSVFFLTVVGALTAYLVYSLIVRLAPA